MLGGCYLAATGADREPAGICGRSAPDHPGTPELRRLDDRIIAARSSQQSASTLCNLAFVACTISALSWPIYSGTDPPDRNAVPSAQ